MGFDLHHMFADVDHTVPNDAGGVDGFDAFGAKVMHTVPNVQGGQTFYGAGHVNVGHTVPNAVGGADFHGAMGGGKLAQTVADPAGGHNLYSAGHQKLAHIGEGHGEVHVIDATGAKVLTATANASGGMDLHHFVSSGGGFTFPPFT
ncbi:MAG: hypothetical protein IT371_31140 [Deltaproteobacteria bacterium]|nr:hypothetical protein [Deltaproteobacteria bacterium]